MKHRVIFPPADYWTDPPKETTMTEYHNRNGSPDLIWTDSSLDQRFAPTVGVRTDGSAEIDLASGEFRAALAAYTVAAAEHDAQAMVYAVERIGSVIGERGASTPQLLDALCRCVASMHAGGPDNIRAEVQRAAEFDVHLKAVHARPQKDSQ